MTNTTSPVHPETVSGWSPIGPLVSGMGSSLAFTIPTGLAEQQARGSPLSAFRTCYGPHRLSAESKSRDLQHLSPVLAHCGNTVLRDMAHVIIGPVNSGIPHRSVVPFLFRSWRPLEWSSPYTPVLKARPSNDQLPQGNHQGSAPSLYQSNCGNHAGFPWQSIPPHSVYAGCQPCVERAWNKYKV